MNRFIKCLEPRAVAAAIVLLVAMSGTAQAGEPPALLYGVEIEELEYRLANGDDLVAWDADAFVGSDIWKARWQSEAEYEIDARDFERLENQFVVQRLATDFFDVKAGVRFDTPEGENRSYAVVGLHGLAQQWFEDNLWGPETLELDGGTGPLGADLGITYLSAFVQADQVLYLIDVTNSGDEPSGAFELGIFADPGLPPVPPAVPDEAFIVAGLGPGEYVSVDLVVRAVPQDFWQSWVIADSAGALAEVNETNNTAGVTVAP